MLAAAIFHGTFNGTGGLAILVLKGGNGLTVGVTGVVGLMVLLQPVWDRAQGREHNRD